MSVTVLCPRLTCRAVLQVPNGVRGKRIRCGECGSAFLVPDGKTASPQPTPQVADPVPNAEQTTAQ
jgi:transposase-like protein